MPDPNDSFQLVDPRLGSLLVSADGHLGASSELRGAPLEFGPPTEAGEAGTLGHYRVVRELGRGGMGAVFLAVDTRLDRRLALKVMLPEFVASAEARARFLREARAAAKISHDNVVTVFEADERDGVPYIAMQLLQGYPLDAFLQKKGTPSLRHSARITREAALGLTAAHKLGIVHRDVKPANLWLETPRGRVKLLDFGLARPDGLDSELTKSGVLIGTPAFMSPEQALGERVDHRTDIFSLGAVLYWLCTGQLPFPGANVMAVLKALVNEEPQPVLTLNPRLPGPLAELIHQLLAKAPQERPQTAEEVANRLHEISEQSADVPSAGSAGGTATAEGRSGAADPWTTLARSPSAQQARPAARLADGARVLRSMPVVAIIPTPLPGEEHEQQPQKPRTGATETVISSGVLWQEVDTKAETGESPERPKLRVKAEVEEEHPEVEAERPDRPNRRATKKKPKVKNSNSVFFLGLGAVGLVALSVIVTLLAVGGGKPKPETVQQKVEEREPAQVPVFSPKEPDNTPPSKPRESGPAVVLPKTKEKDPEPVIPEPKGTDPEPAVPKPKDREPIGRLGLKKRWAVELGPNHEHCSVFCSADSRAAIVLSDLSVSKSLDTATGRVLWDNLKTVPRGSIVQAMAGSRVAASKIDGREGVQVIDAQAGNVTNVPAFLLVDGLTIAAVSPNGRYLSAGRRNTEPTPFKVQRIEDGKFVLNVDWAHGTNIHYTADSSRVLVVEWGGRGRWYKLPSGELDLEWKMNVKKDKVKALPLGLFAGASDGSVFLFDGELADRAGAFHLIDGRTGRAIRSFPGPYAARYGSLSADGRIAVLPMLTDEKDKYQATDSADVIDTTTGGVVATLQLPGSNFAPTVLPDGSGMLIRTRGANPVVVRYDFVPAAAP